MKKIKLDKNISVLLKNKTKKYNKSIPSYPVITTLFSSQKSFKKYIVFITKSRKKKKNIKEEKTDNILRYDVDYKRGLSALQVEERNRLNLRNTTKVKSSKSALSIIAKNLFTFFNLLWLVITVALLAVRAHYSNLLFLFVIVANTAIAIIQELRAKIAVEKLSIVTTPLVKTVRDGKVVEIQADKLVLDDIIILSSGNHIPADCVIVEGNVEVNESLLTGESNSIEKTISSQILSGSFIVSGQCYAKVEKVGKDNYVYQMAKKAKEFKAPQSNLFKDLNRLIKYIGIALVPIGVLTFLKEYSLHPADIQEQVTRTSGALVGMIPAGMFLLITISLAVGVIKLAKKKTLVRDLYSIEMLARTNVLCLDKTGTITDGTMKVIDFITFSKKRKASVHKILSTILNSQKTLNSTSSALVKEFGNKEEFKVINKREFSSDIKYSITEFNNHKIYFLGSASNIGCKLTEEQKKIIKEHQSNGNRVLALAELSSQEFSKDMSGKESQIVAFIVIEEHIREDAEKTIAWFKDNGVEIKIISGDDALTVSKIAQKVGVENSDKFVSLENMSLTEVEKLADNFTVFGRVTPEQKYTIIKTLKNKGKVVAMTGDGVNDTLALKEADCSIAMADGSEVARGISELVLLESNFSSLPDVVKEGRQVINNVQNSSSLFIMKTLFAIILTVITLFIRIPYPFEPGMMLLLEFFIIGIPSFLLAFEPNTKTIKGNFIPQVLKRSLPRAALMLFNVFVVMVLNYSFNLLTSVEYTTLAVLLMTYTGFLNLATLCYPFSLLRVFAMIISFVGTTLSLIFLPSIFFVTNEMTSMIYIVFFSIIAFSILLIIAIYLNKKLIDKLRLKLINLLQK